LRMSHACFVHSCIVDLGVAKSEERRSKCDLRTQQVGTRRLCRNTGQILKLCLWFIRVIENCVVCQWKARSFNLDSSTIVSPFYKSCIQNILALSFSLSCAILLWTLATLGMNRSCTYTDIYAL